jgi:hypothetical protein
VRVRVDLGDDLESLHQQHQRAGPAAQVEGARDLTLAYGLPQPLEKAVLDIR